MNGGNLYLKNFMIPLFADIITGSIRLIPLESQLQELKLSEKPVNKTVKILEMPNLI